MSPRLRRLTGSLLLGVFFATFTASLTAGHFEGQDDPLCLVSEGRRPAALTAKTPTSTPGHCAVCHWVRAVAGAASFGPAPNQPIIAAERFDGTIISFLVHESDRTQSSPRAPPLTSLS